MDVKYGSANLIFLHPGPNINGRGDTTRHARLNDSTPTFVLTQNVLEDHRQGHAAIDAGLGVTVETRIR